MVIHLHQELHVVTCLKGRKMQYSNKQMIFHPTDIIQVQLHGPSFYLSK